MKIISYNVNGLRAAMAKGMTDWLRGANPDVLCVQETKAQPEQIDTRVFASLGYTAAFHSAEKKGYSGVAVFTKTSPIRFVVGMDNPAFDAEGRAWLDRFEASGMVDTFRVFDPRADRYSWWSYRGGARPRNLGWRIDYHWVSQALRARLLSADILTEAVHSDHCPVAAEIA
jgi:exonuclease III